MTRWTQVLTRLNSNVSPILFSHSSRVIFSTPEFLKLISFSTTTATQNPNPNLYPKFPGANYGNDRKILPEKLSKNVLKLSCNSYAGDGVCDVYVVGTNHLSQESVDEVRAIIRYLKPEAVLLELCDGGVNALSCAPESFKVPTKGQMMQQWKKKYNLFGIVQSWNLAKEGERRGTVPGSEFRAAYEEVKKYGGKVIGGDRPAHITYKRMWKKMPFWHKTKLLLFRTSFSRRGLIDKRLKDLDSNKLDSDEISRIIDEPPTCEEASWVVEEIRKEFPAFFEAFIDERDQYMSAKLSSLANKHTSVVAVVGRGHLQGIKKHWKRPVQLDDLLKVPPKEPIFLKELTTLGVAVSGAAFVLGIYLAAK